jgi:hypothetical protein
MFRFNVPIVQQDDDEACWAAAIEAMIRSSGQTVTQADILTAVIGRSTSVARYTTAAGL